MSLATLPLLLAQAGPSGGSTTILYLVALLGIFYFVLWRPQQKQQKDQQAMIGALKKGDDVITSSGILGKVFSVDDKIVTLEVGSGMKLRMLKSSVQGKVTVEPAKTESSDAKKEEK